MKSTLELKCPRCGADLSVEKDRDVLFCQYCGAKILLTDENTFTINKNINQTIHTIDDASITRAETERMVQMHQIELEKQKTKRKLIVLLLKIVFSIILAFITMILYASESEASLLSLVTLVAIPLIWINDISPNN